MKQCKWQTKSSRLVRKRDETNEYTMACTYLSFATHSPALTLGTVDALITKKKTNKLSQCKCQRRTCSSMTYVTVPRARKRAKRRSRHVTQHVTCPKTISRTLGVKLVKRRPAVTSPSRFNLNNNITNATLYTNRNDLLRVFKEININHYSTHTWITSAFATLFV